MNVKHIMLPLSELTTVSSTSTVSEVLDILDSKKLLSLPVIDDKIFKGVIAKKDLLETFVKTKNPNFMNQPIINYINTNIPRIYHNDIMEDAAKLLVDHNISFIPVFDETKLVGIVTHKNIFQTFNKMLGLGETRISLAMRDVPGQLALLTKIIHKQKANIISIVEIDLELMNLREIILRVKTDDIKSLIKEINKHGFRIIQVD